MKGWLVDLFRLAWAFPYWNVRKTLYRLRGAGASCPCQAPSDSGKAHVTGCEAVFGWNRPERFRKVCPLLERGADGRWCCSVNAPEVRPFWGLAARMAVLTAVAGFLIASLGAWAGLRVIGYPVKIHQLVWPPAWHELNAVRSEYFLTKARAAYTAGNIKESMMSLTLAYQLNPENYAAGMMLAQFRQADNPTLSDKLYRQLRTSHPDKRAATTQVWLHHLLVHAAYEQVSILAMEELRNSPHEAAWVNALLFACRQLNDPALLENQARQAELAPEWRQIMEIEAATLRGSLEGEALQRRLRALTSETTNRYVLYYALDRQIAGGSADVLPQVRAARGRLPGRTILSLGLAAYAAAKDDAGRSREIAAVLTSRSKLGETEIEVLCGHLIRYPQTSSLRALVEAWRRDSTTPKTEQMPLYIALYCAASTGSDAETKTQAETWIKGIGKELPRVLPMLDRALSPTGKDRPKASLLPALPTLPIEITYLLLERMNYIKINLPNTPREKA
ncbi:MAG: hypothetical protein WC661_20825 [Opitutaceae bacterium]